MPSDKITSSVKPTQTAFNLPTPHRQQLTTRSGNTSMAIEPSHYNHGSSIDSASCLQGSLMLHHCSASLTDCTHCNASPERKQDGAPCLKDQAQIGTYDQSQFLRIHQLIVVQEFTSPALSTASSQPSSPLSTPPRILQCRHTGSWTRTAWWWISLEDPLGLVMRR